MYLLGGIPTAKYDLTVAYPSQNVIRFALRKIIQHIAISIFKKNDGSRMMMVHV